MRLHEVIGADWASASEDELRTYASNFRFDNDDGSEAWFDPEDGSWRHVAEFPLKAFTHIMTAAQWKKWIKEEIQHLPNRGYQSMIGQEIIEPVVVTIHDKKAHVWDGNHRIGVAFASGAKTIKAIVGMRTSRET